MPSVLSFLLAFALCTMTIAHAYDSHTTSALYLSYAAYCGAHVNASFTCYWCKHVPKAFELVGTFGSVQGSTFGFVGYNVDDNTLYVSYRGTDDIAGWISDFHLKQEVLPWGDGVARVHQGFLRAFSNHSAAVSKLVDTAKKKCSSCATLVVTGHSLGAALSTVAASYFGLHRKDFGFSDVLVLNFGSPRVGDSAFVKWWATQNIAVQRMTWAKSSNCDIVPHLPPKHLLNFRYHHIPTELFGQQHKNKTITYTTCDGSGEDPRCTDQFSALHFSVLDHALYMGVDILEGVPHGCLYTDQ